MQIVNRKSKIENAEWLPDMDLNHDKQIQSLLCYRYTIGHAGAWAKLKGFHGQSSCQTRGHCLNLECGDMSPLFSGATCRAVPKRGHVRALQIKALPTRGLARRAAALLLCLLIGFGFGLAFNASVRAAETNTVLKQVEEKLRGAFEGLEPEPVFEPSESSGTLTVGYKTRKFFVHRASMTGEWSTNTFETVGPDVGGFVLFVNVQKFGTANQAMTPQLWKQPYWETYLNVTVVKGTTNQIYWGLSYVPCTDKELIRKIHEALESLSGDRAPPNTPEK